MHEQKTLTTGGDSDAKGRCAGEPYQVCGNTVSPNGPQAQAAARRARDGDAPSSGIRASRAKASRAQPRQVAASGGRVWRGYGYRDGSLVAKRPPHILVGAPPSCSEETSDWRPTRPPQEGRTCGPGGAPSPTNRPRIAAQARRLHARSRGKSCKACAPSWRWSLMRFIIRANQAPPSLGGLARTCNLQEDLGSP